MRRPQFATTRKTLAAGLLVVGIAGLSVASAAQLNLTGPTAGTLQAGSVAVVNSDCQTESIPVTFAPPTRVGTVYKSAQIDLRSIAAACAGKSYKLAVLDAGNSPVVAEKSGTITAPTAGASTSTLTVDISTLTVTQVDGIKTVALTIYG